MSGNINLRRPASSEPPPRAPARAPAREAESQASWRHRTCCRPMQATPRARRAQAVARGDSSSWTDMADCDHLWWLNNMAQHPRGICWLVRYSPCYNSPPVGTFVVLRCCLSLAITTFSAATATIAVPAIKTIIASSHPTTPASSWPPLPSNPDPLHQPELASIQARSGCASAVPLACSLSLYY